MRRASTRRRRTLAIDPTHRGFGYVVLEEPDRLVDWGLCQVPTGKASRTIDRVCDLIQRLMPDVLLIEDTRRRNCKRGERVRELLRVLAAGARVSDVQVRRVPTALVRERYAVIGAKTKDDVAQFLSTRFPELAPLLPPRRKPWMSEDERMAIFDALLLGTIGPTPLPLDD